MRRQGTWTSGVVALTAAMIVAIGGATATAFAQAAETKHELPSLRTRYSSTYDTASGTRITKVSSRPQNFRDGGRWKRIDSRFVRRGGGFANGANDVRATLPGTLADGSVRVAHDDDWVAFELVGASGRRGSIGRALTYRRALPGVDVRYEALPDGIKEDVVLRDGSAPSTFRFRVRVPAGQPLRLAPGGALVLGSSALRIEPPVAVDARGATAAGERLISYSLSAASDDTYVLELRLSRSWLSASDRRFPVRVDPTVSVQRGPICTIRKPPNETAVNCGPTQEVGHDRRLLLRFDATNFGIPASAAIVEAKVTAGFPGSLATRPELGIHELTRTFDTQATWQRATASQAWTTPGGDVRVPAEDTAVAPNTHGRVTFGVTDAVERWIQGQGANRGFLIRQVAEQAGTPVQRLDLTTGFAPQLVIEWQPALGILPRYGFETYPLPNGAALGVNVGNGNIVVQSPDLEPLRSNGPAFRPGQSQFGDPSSLVTSRVVNTLPQGLTFGYWGFDHTGVMDVEIRRIAGGDRIVALPGQASLRMVRQPDGSFVAPPSRPASLTVAPDGTHRLTLDDTGHTYEFPPLQGVRQASYVASVLGPAGDRLAIERPGGGQVTGFTDGYGGHTSIVVPENDRYEFRTPEGTLVYRHEGIDDLGHRTTHFDDPRGGTTTYRYNYGDQPHILQSIDTPGGDDYAFAYDASGRVREIRHTPPGGGTATTTYEYQSDRTIARYSGGAATTFFFDPVTLKLHRTVTGASPPGLTVTGSVPAADGQTVGPEAVLPLTATATDPSGVVELLVLVDDEFAAQREQSCPGGGCSLTLGWDFEAGAWGPGPHVIEVQARDALDEVTVLRYVVSTARTATEPPDDDLAVLTEEERLAQAIEFRSATGLETDSAYVRAVNADPQYQGTVDRWTVALTPSERDKVAFADASARDIEDVDHYGGTQPDYAELFIDSDGLVHVGFTTDLARHLADLQAVYEYPERLRVFTAQYNRDQLNAVVDEIRDEADELEAQGIEVTNVGVDVRHNDVEVETPAPSAAKEQVLRSRYGSLVRLIQGDRADTAATIPGREIYTRPLMGGLRISGRITEDLIRKCTLGWPGLRQRIVTRIIRGRPVPIVIYDTWFVTAGHCSLEPNGTEALIGTRWTQGRRPFGFMEFAHFVSGDASDFGMIRVASRHVSPFVYRYRRGDEVFSRKIVGYTPRESDNIGQQVCYSGATSGTHCGVVESIRNPRLDLGGGRSKRLNAQRFFRAICRGGDSGAPAFIEVGDEGRRVVITGHVTARTRPARSCYFSNSGHTINYIRDLYVDDFIAIGANP